MSVRHTIVPSSIPPEPAKPEIRWEFRVDNDGDLRLTANGILVAYVSARYGQLVLPHLSLREQRQLDGLALVDCGVPAYKTIETVE